ncbi:MAG: lytic transglycosylase domain-containing protein [Rhizobiaceae bacterium]
MKNRALIGVVTASVIGVNAALSQGVPVGDALGIAEFLQQLTAYFEDHYIQGQTDVALGNKETVNSDIEAVKSETLAATTGTRPVISSLNATPAYASNPIAVETSQDAARLFGKPRATLESKIVKAAMDFKDSAGVQRAGLDPLTWRIMFQSLVKQESAFNPTAESPVGAYGLTQLMPGTASGLGVNRKIIEENLHGGAKYITQQLNTFGNIDYALAAYNAGPGRVHEYNGVPPFKETRGYIARIRQFMREYISQYGGHLPDAMFNESLMSNGEFGYIAGALASYAEYSISEANKSVERLNEIKAQIDASPDLQYSTTLKAAAVLEVDKLQLILIRLRTAVAEAEATYAISMAQMNNETNDYWDWKYR